MANIDRNSPIPIYHQLKTLIREQIESGVWRPGDRIPTEQELCQSYGISRSPVRQALNGLAYEGVLIRRPGLGTFVDTPSPVTPSSDTVIRMMSSDSYWSQVLDQVASVWNVENPHQEITFQVSVVSHRQFYNLLSTAVGNGAAPDVAMVDSVWVAGLAQSGFLYALENQDQELIPRWNHAEFVQDLYPAFVEANSFNGRLYGLPVKADASLLWYRKDWFAQEGLEPPRDWDDLLDVANHFLQPQVRGQYGLAYPLAFPGGAAGGEATVYNLMPFIWSAGGELFDADTGAVVLDSPGARDALQFLRELVVVHRVSPPDVVSYKWDTAPVLFASGKVAMSLGGSYESDIILDLSGWGGEEFGQRVGCVSPPAAPGERPVSTVGGVSYVILRQCQRPALVADVLKVAVRPDVIGELYCSLLQNLPCPSFDTFLSPETTPLLTQMARMIASGHARPSIPEYVKISRQLQAMFEATISNSAPVEEIVERTAAFIGVLAERPCQPV
ncbi:MAG: extracellular solute-binding protein [Chloroflexota bacterium]|nr:extracellular solute-binding protein [Chloroflexota bacterium]